MNFKNFEIIICDSDKTKTNFLIISKIINNDDEIIIKTYLEYVNDLIKSNFDDGRIDEACKKEETWNFVNSSVKKDELTKVLKIFKIVKTKIIANKSIENELLEQLRHKIKMKFVHFDSNCDLIFTKYPDAFRNAEDHIVKEEESKYDHLIKKAPTVFKALKKGKVTMDVDFLSDWRSQTEKKYTFDYDLGNVYIIETDPFENNYNVKVLIPTIKINCEENPDLNNNQLLDIISIVNNTGLDGIIATNTTINRNNLKSANKHEIGGLSGKPLASRSTEVIKFISKNSNKTIAVY